MSMFVDGVRETARDCVANPAESQWKLLILNGQWWWPETLPNTRSRTRMRTLHSPKMGIKCRIPAIVRGRSPGVAPKVAPIDQPLPISAHTLIEPQNDCNAREPIALGVGLQKWRRDSWTDLQAGMDYRRDPDASKAWRATSPRQGFPSHQPSRHD